MMTSTIRKFGVGVASIALVAGVSAPAFADPVDNRLAGADRYETAIKVAEDTTEFNNPTVVYVARGDLLIDAVTAGTLKNGPMLLVNDDAKVQDKVAAAIKKLAPGKVVIIGGEKAVSKETVEKIAGTITTERLSGKDRFATAAAIAGKFKSDDIKKVYLANGMTIVDALVGGQLTDGPILLSNGTDSLPEATSKALNKVGSKPLRALGGTQAVSESVLKQAGVRQVILPETYVDDYQAEVKASALADLKVNGYVTAGPKVTLDKLKETSSLWSSDSDKKAIEQAKVAATFPKIDRTIADNETSAELFAAKDADGKTEAVTYANATAAGNLSETDASGTLAYAGTDTTFENAYAAKGYTVGTDFGSTAAAVGNVFNNGSTVNIKTTKMSSANTVFGANTADKLAKLFPGKFDQNTTIKEFLENIGLSVPSANSFSSSTNPTAANAKTAFDKAVGVAATTRSSALSGLKDANDAAKKGKKEAADALKTKTSTKPINTDVERISGSDRYSTAVAVAKEVFGEKGDKKTVTRVYLANGNSFADAAVAGMLTKGPVLLVGKDMIPASTSGYVTDLDKELDFQRKQIVALGGSGVIADKNLTDEIERVSPANQASGSITFGTPVVNNTGKVEVKVTTKDLPNGSTLKLVWEYKDNDQNKSWTKLDDVKKYSNNPSLSPASALDSDDKAALTATNVPSGKDAKVRLTVETVARNGETITKATTTAIDLNSSNYSNTALTDGTDLSAAASQTVATFTNWSALKEEIKKAKGSDPVAGDFTITVKPASDSGDYEPSKVSATAFVIGDGKVTATIANGSTAGKKFKVEIKIKGYGLKNETTVTTGDITLPNA